MGQLPSRAEVAWRLEALIHDDNYWARRETADWAEEYLRFYDPLLDPDPDHVWALVVILSSTDLPTTPQHFATWRAELLAESEP